MLTAEKLAVEVSAEGVAQTRAELAKVGDEAGDGKSSGWAGKLAMAGTAAFAAVGAAGAGVAGFGLKVAADTEQAGIAFNTLLGPAADDFMHKLQSFAAATPFEFPELRDAASRLLAVGTSADSVIPLMTSLGDATSAMGTGAEGIDRSVTALTQMQQKGKVTGEEMLQLAEAGIPAWDALAAHMGMTVQDTQAAVSAGKVGADQIFQALESNAGSSMQRVHGMMAQQSQSLAGLWSTLKDTVSMGLGDVMGPTVAQLKAEMPDLTAFIGDSLHELAPELNTVMGGVVELLKGLLPAVTPLIGGVADVFGALASSAGPVLKEIAPMISDIVRPLAAQLTPIIRTLVPSFGEALKTLLPAVADLLPPFGRLVEAVLPALAPVLPDIAKAAVALAPPLATVADVLARIITAIPPDVLAALIAGFVTWTQVAGPLTALMGGINIVLGLFGTTLGGVTLAAAPWLLAIAAIAGAAYLIYQNWDAIAAFFAGVWDKIVGAAGAAIGWVTDHLATFGRIALAVMTGGLSELVIFVVGHWDQIRDAAANMVHLVTDNLGTIGRVALALMTGGMSELVGFVIGHWDAIAGAAGAAVTNATAFFAGLPGHIRDALGNLGQIGIDVVVGIWNGIASMGSFLWDHLTSFISDHVPGPIKSILHIGSPSKVTAGLGAEVGRGLALGILGTAGEVQRAALTLADAATPHPLGGVEPYAGVPGELAHRRAMAQAAAAAGGSSSPIPITLELDGRVLAQVLVDPLRGELIAKGQRTGVELFGGMA